MANSKKSEILEKLRSELEKVFENEAIAKKQVHDIDLNDMQVPNEPKVSLPVIPMRGLCVFPGMLVNFDVGRDKSVTALEQAMMRDQMVFLVLQKNEEIELPLISELYEVGTVAKVKQMLKLPGDNVRILVEGLYRGKISNIVEENEYLECVIETPDTEFLSEITLEVKALMRVAVSVFTEYVSKNEKYSKEISELISNIEKPGILADTIISYVIDKPHEKQEILECYDPVERLRNVTVFISNEIELLAVEKEIEKKVREAIGERQKEFYLREQLRTINEELGNDLDVSEEIEEWKKKLKTLNLSEKIEKKIEKEIAKYARMGSSVAESAVLRNYIELFLELPWNIESETSLDIKKAERILNKDHYGLTQVKERILEQLAVIKLSNSLKAPIICLVGPPGVGKTSIARSIARATNREFLRISLGGISDESEIKGHRRTYVASMPGRIISGIRDAGTKNPLCLLDEIDKLGRDYKGDPAAALLEVLDPEQNKEFVDTYLEVPFDLSDVMFITTANTVDTIPRPLRDRMEIISISSYTEEEKVKIAEKYLLPKKIKEHGLEEFTFSVMEKAIRDVINYYTRESGVRNLERQIATICRKTAKKVVENPEEKIKVTSKNLSEYLGKRKFSYDVIEGKSEVGVTTGLAWTAVGGDTLFIETVILEGKGNLVLTGQLGDVMKESAKTGFSYIRSISDKIGIQKEFYEKKDIHIHVPEGATPKDGPSAGVTMCTALISGLTQIPAKKDVAMTGEVTLRGKVLPVGGIKEKVLAAHRAGVKKVLLPKKNEKDLEDIPQNVKDKIEFVLIQTVEEALTHVLVQGVSNVNKKS
ncbi:MAG: endopeptidase La [Eubacteriales bacterium]